MEEFYAITLTSVGLKHQFYSHTRKSDAEDPKKNLTLVGVYSLLPFVISRDAGLRIYTSVDYWYPLT